MSGTDDWSVLSKNEDIFNIACKLISTILCDWHYLVVCQHNSWANFILRKMCSFWATLYIAQLRNGQPTAVELLACSAGDVHATAQSQWILFPVSHICSTSSTLSNEQALIVVSLLRSNCTCVSSVKSVHHRPYSSVSTGKPRKPRSYTYGREFDGKKGKGKSGYINGRLKADYMSRA